MPTYPTLREKVKAVLLAAKFKAYEHTIPTRRSGGTFYLKSGVGVAVYIEWWDASNLECRAALLRFAAALRDAGLVVEDRGEALYVAEPEKRSDEE